MSSSAETILFDKQDTVALITLNRPDVRNAFSRQMGIELQEAYKECDSDDSIRAVVLTGQDQTFCAGADFSKGSQVFDAPQKSKDFQSDPFEFHAWDVRKPVIAAVNGHAIGMGMTIALQCDILVMANDAKYGVVQVRRGIFPDLRSHWTMSKRAGFSVAAELLLTGRHFSADEALAWGIANKSLKSAEVLPAALEIAGDIAQNTAPLSVALSKRLFWRDEIYDSNAVNEYERLAHLHIMGSQDSKEGVTAWIEKRQPQWVSKVSKDWPEWAKE